MTENYTKPKGTGKKFVIIADCMDVGFGGMKTYTKNLIEHITRLRTDSQLYIINTKRNDKKGNVQFISIPFISWPGKFFFRAFYQIPRVIKKIAPDVVLETTHFGPFRLPDSIKRVTVIHDLSTFLFPHYHTWLIRTLERIFLPGIIKKSVRLITVSNSTKKDLMEHFGVPESKISVIPLAAETRFAKTVDQSVLTRLKIVAPYFLCLGVVQPRKNVPTLLRAYEKFRNNSEQVYQLVLVGQVGWKSKSILQEIERHAYKDDIILTGHLPDEDLPALYSMSQAFIYPSFYEGFGLPLLEAMSCGVPCIASKSSSIPEVGGDAPLYFEPNDVDLLYDCMRSIILKEETGICKSKLSLRQAEEFNWELTGKQTLEVLNNT